MSSLYSELALPVEALRWNLKPESLPFASTADLEEQEAIIGQRRGVDAFHFGMGMRGCGYNIFVTGASGIGKLDMVRQLLSQTCHDGIPDDLCYVNNFSTPEEPILLRFEAGAGKKFKEDVQKFLDGIKREIPQLFESQEYINSKNTIIEAHDRKTHEFFKDLEARVKESGFMLVNMQVGQVQRPDIVPIVDGEPVHILKLEEMQQKGRFPKEELEQLRKTYASLKEEIDAIFLEVRALQQEVKRKTEEVDRLMFVNAAQELAQHLFESYSDAKVQKHIKAMIDDMAENLDALRMMGQPPQMPVPMPMPMPSSDTALHSYQVNLLVDNSELDGPPVIIESYPTYRNLFGSIERMMDRSGLWRTDFMRINAGSFIRANGGYLVINLMDAIMEPGVWKTLKRALKTSEMEIQTFDPYYFITAPGIKPEPVHMEVKVVVLATPQLYHMLRYYDQDMPEMFKVWADFDSVMQRDDEALAEIPRFMASVVKKRELLDFDSGAVAALLEYGVRLAGRREKISIAFPTLQDIMAEADVMAKRAEKKIVEASHIHEVLEARRDRAGQIEEKIQEMINRGSLFIDTQGDVVGQVNGLAVFGLGGHMFGKPTRITATTAMGKAGIINIEREAELSGAIHNKGMLILSGYLARVFAQDKPLALSASIAFEQSYGGVDGDSASSTEIYALLSSLSDIPLKQSIAVTGSVNQKGEVQPIGGVNEKIEGFYTCCKSLGITGEQGVMIPRANVKDLMLRSDVVEAVEKGEFSVWAVETIEQGIEILTGHPAGTPRNKSGKFVAKSVFALADAKLEKLALGLKTFGEDEVKDKGTKKARKNKKAS